MAEIQVQECRATRSFRRRRRIWGRIHWYSLIHWFVDSLIHWFIDSLIHWFIDSLIHWFIDSLIHWFNDSLIHWFIDSLIHWFIDSLIHWFIDLATILLIQTESFKCDLFLTRWIIFARVLRKYRFWLHLVFKQTGSMNSLIL